MPDAPEEPLEAFHLWREKAEGNSACDFTFHMGVSRFDESTEKQLREIVAAGVSSFKVFLAYKGAFELDDSELFQTLQLAKRLGVIVTAHTENASLVDLLQKQLLAEGKTGTEYHEPSRPPRVEAEGVNHLMTFAELTGASTYIVHLSCEEALAAAMRARNRGVNVWVETLIQFLLLDKTYAEKPDFEGSKYVMSPPLRDRRNQPVLWNGLGPDRSAPSPPITLRSTSSAKRKWGETTLPKSPTEFRPWRTASTCFTRMAWRPADSTSTASWTWPVRRPPNCLDSFRKRGQFNSAPMPTW